MLDVHQIFPVAENLNLPRNFDEPFSSIELPCFFVFLIRPDSDPVTVCFSEVEQRFTNSAISSFSSNIEGGYVIVATGTKSNYARIRYGDPSQIRFKQITPKLCHQIEGI